jgi:hypothetical protein
MDLKGISLVLKKSGMLVLRQLGLLQLMYPNSTTHHPSFQKFLCWLGLLWFHPLFHCIAHQHNNGKHCLKCYGYFHPILVQLANPLLKHVIQVP